MGFSEKKCAHKSLGSSTVSWQSQLIASIIDKSLAAYIYYYHILLSYVLSYIYMIIIIIHQWLVLFKCIIIYMIIYFDTVIIWHNVIYIMNMFTIYIYILSTTTSFNQYEWWISMIWSITSVIGKWCFMTSIKIFSLIIIYFYLLSFIYDHLFSYFVISFQIFSYIITYCQIISFIITYYHILSFIFTYYQILS